MNEQEKPDKTVYILGAGFSNPAGVPVMKNFIPNARLILERLRQYYHSDPGRNRSEGKNIEILMEVMSRLTEKINQYAYHVKIDPTNLEDVFCLLDIHDFADEDHQDKKTLLSLIVRTLGEICQRNHSSCPCKELSTRYSIQDDIYDQYSLCRHDDDDPCGMDIEMKKNPYGQDLTVNSCIYKAFLYNIIKRNRLINKENYVDHYENMDAVISLNYDLVLERAARYFFDQDQDSQTTNSHVPRLIISYGKGITFTPSPLDIKTFNKKQIHPRFLDDPRFSDGISWLKDKNEVLLPLIKIHGSINWYYRDEDMDSTKDLELSDPQITGNPTSSTARLNRVAIIPPTWIRQNNRKSIFSNLIRQAIRHIQNAKRIVIIGYSMPNTDSYFKYVLAAALNDLSRKPKIEVWVKDQKDANDMKKSLYSIFNDKIKPEVKYEYQNEFGVRGFIKQEFSGKSR